MRPTDFPYHHDAVYDLWHAFRYGSAPHDIETDAIDPLILASWRRCVTLFDHTTTHAQHPDGNSPTSRSSEDLTSLAVPYLEDIHQVVEGTGNAVILTDNEARVLAIEGKLETINTIHKIGMSVGECWSEANIGTNAIGLSLITAMPTQVVGAEHYMQIFHDYGESAAPIHDEQGAIIGTVAVLTHASETNPSQLALVMATARAITNQLQANLNLEQANRRLRQLDSILASVTDGVMTWNIHGQVEHINHMACQILGIPSSDLLGKYLGQLALFPPHIQSAIEKHHDLSDVETRIHMGDRFVPCVMSVRSIYNGAADIIGGVAMLRTTSKIRSLVNRQTSATANTTFDNFAYESSEMRRVIREAQTAAKGSAPVLLVGENGVGKTALAQAIHNASPRLTKPFVVVSCGMIPAEFMVEEILGTDAHAGEADRPSKFELADGGTLVFDMIDQLSLEAQYIVANVMTSRQVQRRYAHRPTTVNVRIIATTTQSLDKLIQTGVFLPQLYYMFSAFRFTIPPLRDRAEDVAVLVDRILERHNNPQQPYMMETSTLDLISSYPWPGNIRELESVVERAIIHADDYHITPADLPPNVRTEHSLQPGSLVPQPAISLLDAEREAIILAGWACHGVVSDMSDVLGINRSTLWRKLKQHNLSVSMFKQAAVPQL
jgi:transcriptional activator for dhaKLM operon